jgi:arylsulfatase A-like enzyme
MLGERFYRFNKYCLYESSVRVPIILSGSALPKKISGKTDHRPAELVDIYPTLLEAAGINVPEKLSGLNLLSDKIRSASFCALHERPEEAAFMWRTDKHKLILMMKRKGDASKYTNDDIIGCEFYNLIDDPNEWNDLYSDKKGEIEIRKKMTKELLEFLKTQEKKL